jgi:hypothetical protein
LFVLLGDFQSFFPVGLESGLAPLSPVGVPESREPEPAVGFFDDAGHAYVAT